MNNRKQVKEGADRIMWSYRIESLKQERPYCLICIRKFTCCQYSNCKCTL